MKAAEGRIGRVFILRLEEGDEVPGCIERHAQENGVTVGYAVFVGGVGSGQIVSGPKDPDARPPDPNTIEIENAHEVAAMGILAPDENMKPVLHIHGSLGRKSKTVSGCFRGGVKTWLVGEVILYEVLGTGSQRLMDQESGMLFLEPGARDAVKGKTGMVETLPEEPEPVVADPDHSRVLHVFNANVN